MSDKNMADVVDRAVDKIASGVERVADTISQHAPGAWAELVAYEKTAALVNLSVFAAIWVLVGVLFLVAYRSNKVSKRSSPFEDDAMVFVPLIAGVSLGFATFIASIFQVPQEVLRYTHPEIAAAKTVLEQVR